jgi:AcrR family transcriptional regulator
VSRKKPVPARGRRIGRDAWIQTAKKALIEGGIDSVKVERLAKRMGATRAAFYYQFENREELLQELLEFWKTTNTEPFYQALEPDSKSANEKMADLAKIWIEEKEYSPKFDSAVRDWARISPLVAKTVKRIDQKRINILRRIFLELGFDESDAFIRARVSYFHQVGYYVLGLDESKKKRIELAPLYIKALLGQ